MESLKGRMAALEEKLAAFQAEEPSPEKAPEPVDFTDMDLTEDDVPAPEPAPAPAPEQAPAPAQAPAAAPDDTADLPWRRDRPGLRVKNIRSGISLYDRALFIGTLFKEDYSLYEQTIRDLNAFVSLDQAVDYIRTHFPQWNLHSDVVYNFMMSIRKKLG